MSRDTQKKIIIILSLLFLTIVLCGCTNNSDVSMDDKENLIHIMGSWVNITYSVNSSGVNESFMRIYNFTDNVFNYSYIAVSGPNRYYAFADGFYELKGGNLIVTNSSMVPPKKASFKYVFSNNYQILTLTSETGLSIVYKKFLNPNK